jgi:hypothetical protein
MRWVPAIVLVAALCASAQAPERTRAPRLWTDEALASWALPIAGVNATPRFYTEAEYYAARVDEVRTYPVYVKSKEPKGYRERLTGHGPQPLIAIGRARTSAEWVAAGREIFDGMDLPENRTDDPRALAWVNDPSAPPRDGADITRDGVIVGVRWFVDRDRKLKLTLNECPACHTRLLKDGSAINGAQGNLNFRVPIFDIFDDVIDKVRKREGRSQPAAERTYGAYATPWLKDDIHARFKTMPAEERKQIDGLPISPGTFTRFNGSPYYTNHMPDLIGVKDRLYLDATATHRNRGPEDIARYGILVTDADDGSVGPYTFMPDEVRRLRTRHSDDAMYALAMHIDSLQPPKNPNAPNDQSSRGEQVFTRSGCGTCHTPPLYTNNKLVPVDGFTRIDHPQSPPASDVMVGARLGLDPGLATKTRKGTGYYKVPSLKGLWYRETLEHSGSIASLEEWFDPARTRADYRSKGWNPPGVKTRAVPGHPFGLNLAAEDKRALIAFLRTL